jgi:hypothetical protein
MAYPVNFQGLAAGNQPLSLLDTMFAQIAAMIAIPCTVAGQNFLTLTPVTGAPTLAAYANFNAFTFVAVNTSTSPVQAFFGALAALNAYKADGATQVSANDIIAGQLYTLIFNQALNGGVGGFYLVAPPVTATQITSGGTFANLRVANNASVPDTRVDVTCDEVVMLAVAGNAVRATNISLTINLAVNGVNGLDTGVQGAAGFYHIFLISNGSTTAGLASRSATAPTMPGGYTYKKRVGTVVCDLGAGQTSGVTISNASPGVVTWNAHGLTGMAPVTFTAGGGTLPAQITPGTVYYVSPSNLNTNNFQLTASPRGPPINTSGGAGTVNAAAGALRIKRTLQYGNRTQYVVGTATSTLQLPVLAGANNQDPIGTYSATAPTWAALPATTSWIPPTAFQVDLVLNLAAVGGAVGSLQIAPNNSYGGFSSTIAAFPWFDTGVSASASFDFVVRLGLMTLESPNIYWATSGVSGATISIAGYVDNL